MTRPSLWRLLARGARWRCPWCGGRRAFFTGWFSKAASCRSCGLRWRRGDAGFELGAAAVSAIIVIGPLLVAMTVGMALTWPDVPVAPLVAILGPFAVLLPIVLYPVSHTLWQAVDLAARPPSPDDFDVERIGSGSPGPGRSADVRPKNA